MKLHIDLIKTFLEMKSGCIRFSDGEEYYTAIRWKDDIIITKDDKEMME